MKNWDNEWIHQGEFSKDAKLCKANLHGTIFVYICHARFL